MRIQADSTRLNSDDLKLDGAQNILGKNQDSKI